ncbi:MAG: hypothetical protein Q4F00_03060 [bacterium]|nr:hypothetical protein [bacterium]
MKRYTYASRLYVTSLVAAALCWPLPSWADPDNEATAPQQKSAVAESSALPETAPPSPAETDKADGQPAEESPGVRTVQVNVPTDRPVTITVLPNGKTIVKSGGKVTTDGVNTGDDYHKNWPAPEAPSFLNYPWPYIPDNFADRPLLGIIDLQPNAHGYASQVKIADAQLAQDKRLVLQRSAVLSSRIVNKLNLEAQQQMLNTPELSLSSRFAPTFFTTKNILLLHPPTNDVYAATLVNLANLRGRRIYAPHTRDAISAHTYLIKQALLPEDQAQQNVIADDTSQYYHCLGATDINAKHAKKVYDSPKQAEAASLNPCPKCFEVAPLKRFPSASQSADRSQTLADESNKRHTPDYSSVRSAQKRSQSPAPTASDSETTKGHNSPAWKDSFLQRPYQSLEDRPQQEASSSDQPAKLSTLQHSKSLSPTASDSASTQGQNSAQPAKRSAFKTLAPLGQFHLQDRCFAETYRHLLRSNGLTDLHCAAFLIDSDDYCAFPYYAQGPIYVTKGLYKYLDTPGELSAALARELAQLLLGYVDDQRVRYFDDPFRPWLLSYRTRRLIEESYLLSSWYSAIDLLGSCGSRPYWSYSPMPLLGYESLSDHAYFTLSEEKAQKTDKVAAVICFAAGYDPADYISYVNKINKLQKYCETPRGDINMWLLGSVMDKERSQALQKTLQSLRDLERSIQTIEPRDPAMARALRTQAALYVSDPQTVQNFIKAYQAAIPAQ